MSDSVTPSIPDPHKDPAAFETWALSPEGQAYWARLNQQLMEQGAREGRKPDAGVIRINLPVSSQPMDTQVRAVEP